MPPTIDITGIDKAELLAALFNASQPVLAGRLDPRAYVPMILDVACEVIAHSRFRADPLYFDYLYGRPIKCDISGNNMRHDLYDRDNGAGAAQRVVDALRARSAIAAAEGTA